MFKASKRHILFRRVFALGVISGCLSVLATEHFVDGLTSHSDTNYCVGVKFTSENDPALVGKRIMEQFLSTEPCNFNPVGYDGQPYGRGGWLPYACASWWANGIDFAVVVKDKSLKDRLISRYAPYLKGGKYARSVGRMYHVDDTITGVIPCAIYLANGDEKMKSLGLEYADTQWTPPCEKSIKERHALPEAEQKQLWSEGYTPQTRFWIDDMYMIIALQTMAYRVTKDTKYLSRSAKEMALYLDRLQLKDEKVNGLFYHAPDTPFIWGRGNGWMAGGMALILSNLDKNDSYYKKVFQGYMDMMATLLKYQRNDGLWGQLVNEPESWGETSGTAMFTYAFIVGCKRGWLDRAVYLPAAEKAWKVLCSKLDEHANIADVCIGTGKKNDHQYYLDRSRINGDPHGGAPMMWCVNAWLDGTIEKK